MPCFYKDFVCVKAKETSSIMANETTVQSSYTQEEADECSENIPPGGSAAAETSRLKVQVEDVNKCYSVDSTPPPASSSNEGKAKSRISGFQSALTPILKYLNIGNKRQSLDPLKLAKPFGTANCQKSTGFHSGRSSGGTDAPVCWLNDESLPEITLLDSTCDSTMQLTRNDSVLPDSAPATPVAAKSVNSSFTALQPPQLSLSTDLKTTAQIPCLQDKAGDSLPSKISIPKAEIEPSSQASSSETSLRQSSSAGKTDVNAVLGEDGSAAFHPQSNTLHCKPPEQNDTLTLSDKSLSDTHRVTMDKPSPLMVCNAIKRYPPESRLDGSYFAEITLLDVTRDSELSPGLSPMDVTQDISPPDSLKSSRPLTEHSGLAVAEPGSADGSQSEELSNAQSEGCVEKSIKTSLEGTQDITVGSVSENSRSSLEQSGQSLEKTQTSTEDKPETHPANITRDLTSSSDMSAQCEDFSTSDMEGNTSSKKVTSELNSEPMAPADTVEPKDEDVGISNGTESTSKESQTSPKTAGSVNSTFSIIQASNLSASTIVNTTSSIACPQNKTLDLPSSNVNSPKATGIPNTETSLAMNPNCSAVKESGPHDIQNATFDRRSLHKSGDSTISQEAVPPAVHLQNNTFDCKLPKQNGTITLSETSSSESHHNTLDKPTSPKVCNLTTNLKDNSSEIHPPELSKHNEPEAATDPSAKAVESTESTFEANPVLEAASDDGKHETKDQSKSGLNMRDGLSDTLNHPSMNTENKASTFNLDDTLDLRADSLITSTPMTNCKVFNFSTGRDEGKIVGAQKKLYGEGPSKPVDQTPSDIPSNIVGDRKTFLTQPAAKSLWPPSKAVSQLLKFRPASTLPGQTEPVTTGLPMTRQRAQAKGLRGAATSDAPQGVRLVACLVTFFLWIT